ncbi:hypothetical protein Tco_0322680 [Tanacetum coccineum]
MEEDAVRLNDRCSVVLQNQPHPKENDLGSFTLGSLNVRNGLADLGASINVMPFSLFKRLQRGNFQPTNMIVEMDDMTKKAPKGIIENVLVQIDKFIFLVDFIIMDMIEDPKEHLILATAHTRTDVFNKQISLGVGNEGIMFKINELVDPPCVTLESVCIIGFSKETREEESFNILKIFKDLFSYESPLCIKLNEFNYLLSIDEDVFTCEFNVQVTKSSIKDDHRLISSNKSKQEEHWFESMEAYN